jgi:3-deoxy-D-manno-octulosonic-acid transferase
VKVVEDAEQAAAVLMILLDDTEQANTLNQAAQKIMQLNTGSLKKHIQVIDAYL